MIVPRRRPSAADVARHYDELDPFYRELWGENLHHGLFRDASVEPTRAASDLVDLVADLAGISRECEVLDVGCGYGAPARRLARGRGARVTGLTLSPVQHRAASEAVRPGEPLRFLLGDWMDSGLPDEAFDVVIAIESLAHMPDKERFFREVRRTLRPGGRWVVCAWAAGPGTGYLGRRFLLEPICREGELPGVGTLAEYRALATEAGLEVREVRDSSREVRRTWDVCARRLGGALLRRRDYRRVLLDRRLRSRVFAATVFRIWLAYRTGAMRYGILVGGKDGTRGPTGCQAAAKGSPPDPSSTTPKEHAP
jgi:tocopherol O-methyltransferase